MAKQAVIANLVMKEIGSLRRRRAEIAEAAEAANKKLAQEIEKLRQIVLNGKATSDDRITDYFLAAGHIDDEVAKPFRDIEAHMKGKKGELFLVVQRNKKRCVFGMPGHSSESDYILETRTFLGKLSSNEWFLDMKKRTYGLPTKSYVELEVHGKLVVQSGPFVFKTFYGLENLGKGISAGHDSGPVLEIFIGDKAAFDYSPYRYVGGKTRPRDWVNELNRAARLLGKDIPEAPEEKALKEEEKKNVLARLEQKYDAFKIMERAGSRASRREVESCEDMVRTLLVQVKELGLERDPLVVLVKARMEDS